jgi:hypothetical protein
LLSTVFLAGGLRPLFLLRCAILMMHVKQVLGLCRRVDVTARSTQLGRPLLLALLALLDMCICFKQNG